MRFSEAWLRTRVNPPISTDVLVEQLTMAGLEVDSVEPAVADFSGIVVGQVITIQAHPNADKLRVCTVAVGGNEPLQIVCGASNISVDMRVPTALVGAVLPGDFKIKKSKLRGEMSLGMLCSEQELGLAENADGLMELAADAPVGEDIRAYLELDDSLIEVNLSPNRADCLSIEGVAREVALLNKLPLSALEQTDISIDHNEKLTVAVDVPELCPRYLGRLIKGVDPTAQTPLWMQERLRRSGLPVRGPLVDVTNYILLELGQPLHAFDAAKLSGGIQVRMGNQGEQLALLNDQILTIDQDVMVIADQKQALALAGVMGGSVTAVSDDTVDVFLECAFFNPESMMGKARRFGLHTDASHRFERGVDPQLQQRAIDRATELILAIAAGSAGSITEVSHANTLPKRTPVTLRPERINKILGITMGTDEVQDILERLGMTVQKQDNGWQVTPPGFRFDIAIEADLIEEMARIYGYNKLPQTSLLMRSELAKAPESLLEIDRIKDLLVDLDYQEAITYSFVNSDMQKTIAPNSKFISLQNPISSELSVMRTTIWCGLLLAAQHNTRRQHSRVRLFEAGMCFINKAEGLQQEKMLAGLALGNIAYEQWDEQARAIDFYDMKADIEALVALTGHSVQFVAGQHSALHPSQSANILTKEGELLGYLGMLHPSLEKQLGFDKSVFLFELNQDLLLNKKIPTFKALSELPSVRRDLAPVFDENVAISVILDEIKQCHKEVIQDVVIFDVYRGQGIETAKKSVALGLIIQDSKQTLKDSEIDAIVNGVLDRLITNLDATLRK